MLSFSVLSLICFMKIISSEVTKALEFCARAHVGQFRRASDVPFASHPSSVGFILHSSGYSEEVVIAGILHDVIEDTTFSFSDIESSFGLIVANLVAGVTEGQNFSSWEEKKEDYLRKIESGSPEVKAISAADLLDNCRSMLRHMKDGNNIWTSLAASREKQLEFFKKRFAITSSFVDPSLRDSLLEVISQLEAIEV